MFSQYFNLYFPISSLIINIILCIMFFSKKKLKNVDTLTYSYLLIFSLIESITMFLINLFVNFFYAESFFGFIGILNKLLYAIYIVWLTTFFIYMIKIGNRKYSKKFERFLYIVDIIIISLIFVTPIGLYYQDGFTNSYGLSSTILYIGCSLYVCAISFLLIFDYKKAEYKKKYIPSLLMVSLMIFMMILRLIDPLLNVSSNIFSIITLIMYFTIENPDLKMLEEYIKNKKLTEDNIEDKANMLFKISEEVKEPVEKIYVLSNNISRSNNLEDIYNYSNNINFLSKDISNVINKVMNISNIDINNIKIINNTYNIYSLFNQIILLTNENINKNIEFKYSISSLVPHSLYGDNLKLKQVINSIINNSINHTNKGFIDIDISSINRYDVARLLITIRDTSNGIPLEKINEILEYNKEFNENNINDFNIDIKYCKRIIDMLGGTLLIKSEINRGSEYRIILDQKINKLDKDNIIEKYSFKYSNKKKVLLVDDNYEELELISKELKINNYEVYTTLNGKDCIDKLNNGIKFDYIFINDEMNYKNAVDLIKEIDLNTNKVIIMLNEDKEFIKDNYLKDYNFYDYLLKNKIKSEINRIKNK